MRGDHRLRLVDHFACGVAMLTVLIVMILLFLCFATYATYAILVIYLVKWLIQGIKMIKQRIVKP